MDEGPLVLVSGGGGAGSAACLSEASPSAAVGAQRLWLALVGCHGGGGAKKLGLALTGSRGGAGRREISAWVWAYTDDDDGRGRHYLLGGVVVARPRLPPPLALGETLGLATDPATAALNVVLLS